VRHHKLLGHLVACLVSPFISLNHPSGALLTPHPVSSVEVIQGHIIRVDDIDRLVGGGDRNHRGAVVQQVDYFRISCHIATVRTATTDVRCGVWGDKVRRWNGRPVYRYRPGMTAA
jgi:hypothetical protein